MKMRLYMLEKLESIKLETKIGAVTFLFVVYGVLFGIRPTILVGSVAFATVVYLAFRVIVAIERVADAAEQSIDE